MIAKHHKLARWLGAGGRARLPDLGERELAVLKLLWAGGEATAQSIQTQMPGEAISLSTVQSTLERLHRKKLVRRVKQGRAYCYRAALSQPQLIGGLLQDLADDVAAGELAPMLSGFLEYVSAEAPGMGDDVSRALGIERNGGQPLAPGRTEDD